MIPLFLLAGSFAITALSFLFGYPFFFLLVFFPLFFLRRRGARRCPVCGWEAKGGEQFCPFDRTPLCDES